MLYPMYNVVMLSYPSFSTVAMSTHYKFDTTTHAYWVKFAVVTILPRKSR